MTTHQTTKPRIFGAENKLLHKALLTQTYTPFYIKIQIEISIFVTVIDEQGNSMLTKDHLGIHVGFEAIIQTMKYPIFEFYLLNEDAEWFLRKPVL